jgi:hypothetical protein
VHFPHDLSYIDDLKERHRARREWTHGCTGLKRGKEEDVCLAKFRKDPDWNSLLARLVSHRVATLPDESTLPSRNTVLDGVAMVVEIRTSDHYRAYEYSNPSFRDLPETKDATQIMTAVYEIVNRYGR